MPESKKESRFRNIIKSQKAENVAGGTAAAATFGAGMIDLRPKADLSNVKHLGNTWQGVKGKLQPGDVIVGSSTQTSGSVSGELKHAYKTYSKEKKKGGSVIGALNKSKALQDIPVLTSKFGDPKHSHSAVVVNKKGQVASGGASVEHITNREIPLDKAHSRQLKAQGIDRHFYVARPNKGVSNINTITKQKGSKGAIKYIREKAGQESSYRGGQAFKNQIRDWLLPKFNRTEKIKSKSLRKKELCVGGICSTTGAQLSDRTVGGKSAKHVLPGDYLKSKDYKVIGKIGNDKTGTLSRMAYNIPKYTAKIGVAAAVGATVYGGVKGYKAIKSKFSDNKGMTKKAFLEKVYNESFNNELSLITGK